MHYHRGQANSSLVGLPPYPTEVAGTDDNHWARNTVTTSPVSPLSPMNQHTTMTSPTSQLSPTPIHKTELSGEPAPSISELSPTPERSAINTAKRTAVPAFDHHGDGRAERSSPAEEPAMQPSLDLSTRLRKNGSPKAGDRRQHVMSWMDFDDTTPAPAR